MCTTKEYISLFRKYQKGEASFREMNELLKGFEDDGKFCQWMDQEWQSSDNSMSSSLRSRLYAQIRQRVGLGKSHRQGRLRLHWSLIRKAAAIFIVLVAIGAAYWHFNVGTGERWGTISAHDKFLQVTLPDSSHVWLCRYSSLQYPTSFRQGYRSVRLTGEAYFDVRHDSAHPFIVESRRIRIRVTGTKFSVSDFNKEGISKVVLCEGSVNVSRQGKAGQHEFHLRPNNAYILFPDGRELVQPVDAQSLVTWKDGYCRFSDTRLNDILQRIGSFYGKDITCDSSVGSKKVSCTIFLNDSFEVALRDLGHIVPISWKTHRNKCHVMGK